MNENERIEYLANVEKWTEESYPRLAALDDSWKEADVKDFDEGLKLATALQKAQGFINTHQRYDVKRRLEVLRKLLNEVRIKSGLAKAGPRPVGDKRKFTAVVPPPAKVDDNGLEIPRKPVVMPEVSDRRPEHIAQYISMLSPQLQEEAKGIAGLYDQLAHWRSRAEYLSADPRADRAMVSAAAKKTVAYESRILNFWQRVDLEYAKVTKGKIDESLMDELQEQAKALAKPEVKSAGEYTREEIGMMDDEEMRENCRRARIEANKKYLRRDDTQMTDERKAQLSLRAEELVAWGVQLSAKAVAILEKHGIAVPVAHAAHDTEGSDSQLATESAPQPMQTELDL